MTSTTLRRSPLSAPFLDRLYHIPNVNDTMEECERWHHLDLAQMDTAALRREGRAVRFRLDHERDHFSRAWLAERLEALRAALDRRAR